MSTGSKSILAIKITLAFLIIASISLPSGSFLGFPIKHLAYISALFSIFFLWRRLEVKIPTPFIAIFIWSLGFVSLFAVIGALKGIANPFQSIQEGVGLFTTISMVLMGLTATNQKWVAEEDLIHYAVWGATIFSTLKNAIALAMIFGFMSFGQATDFYSGVFNTKFVSSAVFGGLIRVNFIIYDFVVLLLLTICILQPDATKKCIHPLKYYFIASATLCIFFAFSRYLFIATAFFLLYALIFKWGIKSKIAALAIFIPLASLNAEWIDGVFKQRFTSSQNYESDDKRAAQMDALLNQWEKSPLIGSGLGSYARSLVRDHNVPYSYEVQWFGFLAKLGVIGISYLLALIALAYHQIISSGGIVKTIPLWVMLTMFLGGGFTNQYLITSGSGVFYLITICAAHSLKRQNFETIPNSWKATQIAANTEAHS